MKLRIIPALVLVCLFLPAAARGDDGAAAMLEAVNRVRADAGLSALAPDARLACAAHIQATDNARRRLLDHRGADGTDLATRLARVGYPYRLAAENLALAGDDAAEVTALWRASPGHRRNMLTAGAEAAGIARVAAGRQWVWVLVVAAEMGKNGGKPGVLSQFHCESG